MPLNNHLKYGYYVFLGNGDYHKPDAYSNEWTFNWKLQEWNVFIDKISDLGANTLMVYLNGHTLPFISSTYPSLSQYDHPNCKNEFFSNVIVTANTRNIDMIGVISTTGHAGKYLEIHPELAIKPHLTDVNLVNLLTPFPIKIREKKNQAKNGAAQIGLGTLCHNNPESQIFSINILKDTITKYHNLSGVALHPPESIYPCCCNFCCALFKDRNDKNLLHVGYFEAMEFYFQTYLEFQTYQLEPEIKKISPILQIYTFTIPWLFEIFFEKIAHLIPNETILIDWDYNLDKDRVERLPERISRYNKFNHNVWFMPTAGFGISSMDDLEEKTEMVKLQMSLAIEAGINGIVHFIGPNLSISLEATNLSSRTPNEDSAYLYTMRK